VKSFFFGEYLAKLQARAWLSHALCAPGQHTAKRRRFDRIMVMSLWPRFLVHPVDSELSQDCTKCAVGGTSSGGFYRTTLALLALYLLSS